MRHFNISKLIIAFSLLFLRKLDGDEILYRWLAWMHLGGEGAWENPSLRDRLGATKTRIGSMGEGEEGIRVREGDSFADYPRFNRGG